jgi:hypothetical protein
MYKALLFENESLKQINRILGLYENDENNRPHY